jgi:hypothetical protein
MEWRQRDHAVMRADAPRDWAAHYRVSPSPAHGPLGGARSTVDVPMLKDHESVGAFSIYRQEVRPFSEKQIEHGRPRRKKLADALMVLFRIILACVA